MELKRLVKKSFPVAIPLLKYLRFEYERTKSKHKWKKITKQEILRLEIGSGPKRGSDGWITVDLHGADITHDLRSGIPLPDGSVDMIYCSHLLEHIPFKNLVTLLLECNRVLKTNGQFSVCVPNFRFYVEAYMNRTQFIPLAKCYAPAVVDTGSYIDQLNYMIYMNGEHKFMFDEQNIVNILKIAGFKNAETRGFNPALDLEGRDFESLYANATK